MKRLIEFVSGNILWEILKMTTEKILGNISTTISCIVWGGGFLLLNGYLLYAYFLKKPRTYFAFPCTGKLFSRLRINNPDDFPSLNLSALKRHISLIVKNPKYNFNRLIQSITLYRGFGNPDYVLVVEIPDTISTEDQDDYNALLNHWSDPACLSYSANDKFRLEVYQNESTSNTDPYLENWFVWTKKPNEDVPQELALKDHKWALYN
ncbi:MAG: hypothetical protein PHP23_10525 [Desulfobacterales bacterium]|nr:hypothetical protein [Desulfobacterales bacterium]MDD4072751.1 hypothetical protein [Desulfobacterales bacterium]MDD4392467.1 hypothetical protein [Desulfobacterales bacterium]